MAMGEGPTIPINLDDNSNKDKNKITLVSETYGLSTLPIGQVYDVDLPQSNPSMPDGDDNIPETDVNDNLTEELLGIHNVRRETPTKTEYSVFAWSLD